MHKNKVIILGDDNVNTLGVIRNFGENGIKAIIFIISDTKFIAVKKSKYVEKCYICENEQKAIKKMIELYGKEEFKPVIFTTSDKATSEIDKNYNKLNNNFIISNINNTENQINKYMDKYEQYKVAKECNINMAKSMIIDISLNQNVEITPPVIIKPLISAEGKKIDITICKTEKEIQDAITFFKNNNYKNVLIQEFLNVDCEYDIAGFAYKDNIFMPVCTKKIRIWPEKKGSTTYGKIESIEYIKKIERQLKTLITTLNYKGIFDIEIFQVDNQYYFNEMNFRNSCISYSYNEYNCCYNWYLAVTENKYQELEDLKESYYFISDVGDIHHVIEKRITLKQYLKDKKTAKVKLISNSKDMKPALYMFLYKFLRQFKKLKNNKRV